MAALELAFASKDTSLTVRTFSVKESISELFDVSVIARSEVHDLDLDHFIGKGGMLCASSGVPSQAIKGARSWHGVVSHMEQLAVEPDGLSTYYLRIVPDLWRTTLRRNARLFQGKNVIEICKTVLAEWDIEVDVKISEGHTCHEYKVQYDETDYAFMCRLLEEAGISFFFEHAEVAVGQKAELKKPSRVVLCDAPHQREARAGGAIQHHADPTHLGQKEYVSKVKLAHKVKAGKVTVRDFDFRTRPDFQLLAEARHTQTEEDRYEQFHYQPGCMINVEQKTTHTPVADDRGAARVDEKKATLHAQKILDGHRSDRRKVSFKTNAIDLCPGSVTSMSDHPRADLSEDKKLLVTHSSIEGGHDAEWHMHCECAFTEQTYRPAQVTQKKRIYGVQSAIVCGPSGEEIHTDEFGRVRVQFHWDRQGKFDEQSSCWIRVSQSWAGSSYGMLSIPRVGQEVLVEFFEGDPDKPVITGRVFNNTTRTPYKLPDDKTKSGWKSASCPGADGFNELMFDDKKGKELVFLQAQKDLSVLVKDSSSVVINKNRATNIGSDDSLTVGANLRLDVASDHAVTIGGSESIEVCGSRSTVVSVSETVTVGESYALALGAQTGIVIQDQKLTVTSGNASIVISNGNIFFDAAGDVTIAAGGKLTLSGREVCADASPLVMLNCAAPTTPNVMKLAKSVLMHGVKEVEKEADHLAKAIEMTGKSAWNYPGELCAAVKDAPNFIQLDKSVMAEIKKDVAGLKKEAALIKKEIQPYLHYVRLVENLIEHHDWKAIEREALHLLGLDELDGMLGGVNKHKLYGGQKTGHGPGQVHHGGAGGNQHQGGGNQHHGGGNQHHGGGNQHQGGGNQHQGGGNQHHGGGNQHQGGGSQHHGGGNQHQGGGSQHHGGGGNQHHGGQQHHGHEQAPTHEHQTVGINKPHDMNDSLGPRLGPKVSTDTERTATIHESLQKQNIHDAAKPALLGQSWNHPVPPPSQASPGHLGQVVNGMGQVQVFHVAGSGGGPGGAAAGIAAAAGVVALGGGAAIAATQLSSSPPQQYLALKTAETPYQVDEDDLYQQQQKYLASGMSDQDATAKAFQDHGVALYEGDGEGNFQKVLV